MNWQDIVIGAGQALFSVALIPSILGTEKPPRSTCAMTGAVLAVYVLAFASLGMWWAAGAAALCSACWTVLLTQRRVA